jgi:hypothetical protein
MKSPDRYIEWWSSKTAYLRSHRKSRKGWSLQDTMKVLSHLRATWSFGPRVGQLELWPASGSAYGLDSRGNPLPLTFRVNSRAQADRIARDFIGFGVLPTVAPDNQKSARAAVRKYKVWLRCEDGSPAYKRYYAARRRAARVFLVVP